MKEKEPLKERSRSKGNSQKCSKEQREQVPPAKIGWIKDSEGQEIWKRPEGGHSGGVAGNRCFSKEQQPKLS